MKGHAFISQEKPKHKFDSIAFRVKNLWWIGCETHETSRRLEISRREVYQILGLDFDEDELLEHIGEAMVELYNLSDTRSYESDAWYINAVIKQFWIAEDKRRAK